MPIRSMDLFGEASLAQEYAEFAAQAAESPVIREWSAGIAGDPEVLALIEPLPRIKRQPNLVIAATRWHGAQPGPYAGFREVLLSRWDAIRDTVLARSTQTNEVGRCATLLPAIAAVAGDGPVALVEVGPSAGLTLLPDRCSYRWTDGSGHVTALDPAAGVSTVVLSCEVSGDVPRPRALPDVRWRAGVDLNPLDVHDEESMAWLRTLVWPGQPERLARLDGAIELARTDPPYLVRGDLLTDLPRLLEQAPAEATLVVQHSAVIAYLEPDDRARFDAMMRALVRDGVHWVSNEGPSVLPGVTGEATPPDGMFVLGLDGRAVAWTHGHGARLAWL